MKVRQLTTCETCRKRKISCDGKTPACTQCSLRGHVCPGYPQDWIFVPQKSQNRRNEKAKGKKKDVLPEYRQELIGGGTTAVIPRPLTIPMDDFITVVVRGCVPDHKHELGLPGNASRVCGAWVEVLPDLLGSGTNTTLSTAIKAFAVSILSGGPVRTAPMSMGLEAKSLALTSLRKALRVAGKTYSDELAATVMCVLFSELFIPTTLRSWVAHLEGFVHVMQLSQPELYISGRSHKLFIGARPSMIVLGFFTRKATFVADERWRTIPFSLQPASPVQEIMTEGATIPGILEKLDLLEAQAYLSPPSFAEEVLQAFIDVLDRLNLWEGRYSYMSRSSSHWLVPNHMGGRPHIWFRNIMTANALQHFWAFKIVCLTNIERLCLTFPGLMADESRLNEYLERETIFDGIMRLSTLICQSVEYLMQDDMRLFGPTSAVLPLRVAFDVFRAGELQSVEELEWCEGILEYTVSKGYHFVSMFFEESRLSKSGGMFPIIAVAGSRRSLLEEPSSSVVM